MVLILIILGTFIYSIRVIQNQKKNTRIKTDFINNMTHELKTPIATIGLACEALTDKNIKLDKSSQNRFLTTIKSENVRLGKLVENVLESSVSVKASPELKLEVFNIEEVIKKAIKSIQLSYNTRNGKIKTDFLAQNKIIEVHISNIEERENYRKFNLIKEFCEISIIGEGIEGYFQALDYINDK